MSRDPSVEGLGEPLAARIDFVAGAVLLVGFGLRLWTASIAYLNPDEVYHLLLANPVDFLATYESAIRSPHPPFLVMFLHYVKAVSTSEIWLRFWPALAGTLFPLVMYRWIGRGWSKTAGLIAVVILVFTPNLVNLGSELRGYSFQLLFLAAALYFLDTAIEEASVPRMAAFALFQILTILSEFSSIWFCVSVGIYFLLRIREQRISHTVRMTWEVGQMVSIGLYMFLYFSQLKPLLRDFGPRGDVAGWLSEGYPQPGGNPLVFVLMGTLRQFSYITPYMIPMLAGGAVFCFGVWLVWRTPRQSRPAWSKSKAVLLLLPFAITCLGAFAMAHPYGRSRHTVFLLTFIATGAAIGLDRLLRQKAAPVLIGAFLLVPSWHVAHMGMYDSAVGEQFAREHMEQAVGYLRQQAPPGSLILTESETRVLLAHYLGQEGWLPELNPVPTEEKLVGYRVFANRWNFDDPSNLED
ncbi:MAG: glycosyltransferase family 39 protein, partial [bacterium]|nr:glycosyltransferase family 39 protein [bacterium]